MMWQKGEDKWHHRWSKGYKCLFWWRTAAMMKMKGMMMIEVF